MTNLDLYVARAKLPISVRCSDTGNITIYPLQLGEYDPLFCRTQNHLKATRAYATLRDRLMAERGQITDQVV